MVNITKPPTYKFCNNYNTIAKEIQEHQNLFPEVGPIDFSTYKKRNSTINYDIIEAAKNAQLQLEAIQNVQDGENVPKIIDDSKEEAIQFQSLLGVQNANINANVKKSGRRVQFEISTSMSSEDDNVANEFIDYHIDDNEDKERLRARKFLFTTLQGAQDSLVIFRPKFDIHEPIKSKQLILEPKPISAIDILVKLLTSMNLPFQPPKSNLKGIQDECDVIVTVRKSFEIQDTERILCHSQILNKSCNAFKEMFDLYVWDMELQEKSDIHCATTTGWLVINLENYASMILLFFLKLKIFHYLIPNYAYKFKNLNLVNFYYIHKNKDI